jgi:Tfp pilus assembly protein PilX
MRNPCERGDALGPADSGSVMILTLMVLAIVTSLATTVAVVTINNLQASWRAQQAGAALSAADAGVAQAMAYLRNNGVRDLRCSPSCSTNPWGNESAPAEVAVSGTAGQSYSVWVQAVTPFPQTDPGLYRIHSTGRAAGSASRLVTADVRVTTTEVPKGIFARTINGGGAASVARESIFSTGCVYNRSKISMVEGEIDLAYGIPIAVHSSQIITDSNGTGQYCPTTNKPIHRSGNQNQNAHPCNTSYPYDQDRLGGSLVGTTCESTQTSYPKYYGTQDFDGDGSPEVDGSFIKDDATLFKLFGIRTPALTQAQIDQMRTIAQSQGNYWTSSRSTDWSSPDESNAIMFFDLTETDPGGTVDLNDITGFSRDPNMSDTDANCESKSLTIVIEGGNVKLNSNQKLFASLFLTSSAPHGQVFKANGTSEFIGTIYADIVNLTGTANLSMDPCFLANVSPALLDLSVSAYREQDRGLG